jgi:hypothetical protein
MNPRPVLRQAERVGSRGAPRLIGGACRCMAAHVERRPRLTLKAGHRAGVRGGCTATAGITVPRNRQIALDSTFASADDKINAGAARHQKWRLPAVKAAAVPRS